MMMRERETLYLVAPDARDDDGHADRRGWAGAEIGHGAGVDVRDANTCAQGSMRMPSCSHQTERYADASGALDLAQELWWLAGDAQRAGAIAELVERAVVELDSARRPARVLHRREIAALLALLEDLDEALKQTIVDDELNIRPEHMAEVRRRAELIDVDERRGELASAAVWEALARVWALRNLLEDARERWVDIALNA